MRDESEINNPFLRSLNSPEMDDARRQYERLQQGDGLKQALALDSDKDGNSHFLGLTVSKTLKPALETLLAAVIPYATRYGSEVTYKKILSGTKSTGTAALAENAVRWGLIFVKPISDIVHAGGVHSEERKALYCEFAPVIAATKANYRNNEVIRTAFDQLHDDLMTDLKMVGADLPALTPMVLFGAYDQVKFAKSKPLIHDEVLSKVVTENGTVTRTAPDTWLDRVLAEEQQFNASLKQRGIEGEEAERLRQLFREEHAAQKEQVQHPDEKLGTYNNFVPLLVPALAAYSQTFKDEIGKRAEARRKGSNAWEMIKHLKEEVGNECASRQSEQGNGCERSFTSRSADDIYISGIGTSEGKRLNLKDYIVEIFQQHERDRAPALSGLRRDKDGKESLSNPLGPALVSQLMPAADVIADYIADGRLDAHALVNLVGENKVIVHQKSGGRQFAKADQVQKALNDLVAVLNTRETITPEEFFANFADPALIQDTLKNNLKAMHGAEKAFFVSLFPDDILLKAGMRKKEILAERKLAHENVYDIVGATVLHIARLAKEDPERLKVLGLNEQETAAVTDLVNKIESGDYKALQTAVDGRDKTVVSAVRTAGLHEQLAKGGDAAFWRERVKESGEVRQKLLDLAAKKTDSSNEKAAEPFAKRVNTESVPPSALDREMQRRDRGEENVGTYVE